MKKLLLIYLAGLFALTPAISQVVINEFMSSNNSTIADEDGDYSRDPGVLIPSSGRVLKWPEGAL